MSASRDKGTLAERLVARHLQASYWPYAERRALAGSLDKGDITGTPGLVWEVKSANRLSIPAWLRETEKERVNAGADFATLVIKPSGVGKGNVGQFYALMDGDKFDELSKLACGASGMWRFDTTVRKTPIATAIQHVHIRSEPLAVIRYRDFALTSLDRMTSFLVLAGYGSFQEISD